MSQWLESLPIKGEVLTLNPRTTKNTYSQVLSNMSIIPVT
jgi:hypothetical protein